MPWTLTANVRAHSSSWISWNGLFGPDDPGAVDEDVDRPDALGGRGDRGRVGDVDDHVGAVGHVEGDDPDAVLGEPLGAGAAEAAQPSGDEGGSSHGCSLPVGGSGGIRAGAR